MAGSSAPGQRRPSDVETAHPQGLTTTGKYGRTWPSRIERKKRSRGGGGPRVLDARTNHGSESRSESLGLRPSRGLFALLHSPCTHSMPLPFSGDTAGRTVKGFSAGAPDGRSPAGMYQVLTILIRPGSPGSLLLVLVWPWCESPLYPPPCCRYTVLVHSNESGSGRFVGLDGGPGDPAKGPRFTPLGDWGIFVRLSY